MLSKTTKIIIKSLNYIDLSTGSLLIQVALASGLTGLYLLRGWFKGIIARWFKKKK